MSTTSIADVAEPPVAQPPPDEAPVTPPTGEPPAEPPTEAPVTPPEEPPTEAPVTPPEEPPPEAPVEPVKELEVPTIVIQEPEEIEEQEIYGLEDEGESNESIAIKGSVGFRLGHTSYSDDAVEDGERQVEGEEEEMDDELARSDHTFEKLLEIYQFTVAGLEASEREGISLDPIKKLFQAVWDGVEQSHQNVVNLQSQDYDISANLSTVMAETRTLIKLAEDDPELASRLKAKLEIAWNLADLGEVDEGKNNVRIMELKDEIAILNRNIMAASKAQGQETIVELQSIKAELEAEKVVIMTEVGQLQTSLDMIYVKRQNLTETKANLEEKMKLLIEEERVQKASVIREQKRKEVIDAGVKVACGKIRERAYELRGVGKKIMDCKGLLFATEKNVLDQRIINEEVQRGMELSGSKAEKLKADYEHQTKVCHKLTVELFKKQADLKEKEDELAGIRQEVGLASRQLTSNLKKVAVHKVTITELEADREVLKAKLVVLERDLELAQKKLEENKRKIEELDKNRAGINRTLQRAAAIANEHVDHAITHEMAVKNLQAEITGYDREIAEQNKCIARLERERDNYAHEAMKLAHELSQRLEEVKKLDLSIFEYRKRLGETEDQLKKIQQIYETAVYDRALLQRSLTETQKEIYNNNLTITHLGHKIKSLIFQVSESDNMIHREVMKYERLIKDTVFFTSEAKRIKGMAHDVQRMVEALDIERSTLGRTVAEAEGEISKQKYFANSAESRKSMFYRKLMAKEQELRDIWNKWRVLHSTIRIGAYHFRNLMTEIRQIRYDIFLAKKERLTFSNSSPNMRKLTHEVVILENIISQETCMCNTLRESMKHPINVHRWRVLQATDPDAYDMVLKVNLLTKRLVERNSILTDQSVDLAFKQEIYCQIRDALKKAPGLEAPENVLYHRHLQKAKVKQYEALKYELKAAESQTEYYEEEIRRLQDRLKGIKIKYFRRQKQQGKKICKEYQPLQIEMDQAQDSKIQSLVSGMEWKQSESSSLTMYTGESEESSGGAITEKTLLEMAQEKVEKRKRKITKMRIGRRKTPLRRNKCRHFDL